MKETNYSKVELSVLRDYFAKNEDMQDIAARYNVTVQYVAAIVCHLNWNQNLTAEQYDYIHKI